MSLILYVDRLWESPYALSAFVALEEKGVPFETRDVALESKEQHSSGYGALTARIPSLVDGELWLAESSAIVEYVDEAYPAPRHPRLMPEDVRERAVCRQIQAWVRSDFMALREERPTTSVFFPEHRASQPLSSAARRASEKLVHAAEKLLLGDRTSLFGAWCIADSDLAMMLMRLCANGDPVPARVSRYAEAQWQRPSIAKWVGHQRPPFVPH